MWDPEFFSRGTFLDAVHYEYNFIIWFIIIIYFNFYFVINYHYYHSLIYLKLTLANYQNHNSTSAPQYSPLPCPSYHYSPFILYQWAAVLVMLVETQSCFKIFWYSERRPRELISRRLLFPHLFLIIGKTCYATLRVAMLGFVIIFFIFYKETYQNSLFLQFQSMFFINYCNQFF